MNLLPAPTRPLSRLARWSLVVIVTASALVSCSDDGESDSSPTTSPPPTAIAEDFETAPVPEVEGPITGSGEIYIDGLEQNFPVTVDDFDYLYEEFFVSGIAADEPYVARLMITRPAEVTPETFSGHVLLEAKHGTGIPFVWNFTREYLMANGHAAAEITIFPETVERTLKGNDPERYATLDVEEEQASDIYAQIGVLLKSDQSPLPETEWLHMSGHSMAVGPVWSYMDTHHDRYRLADGSPIYDGYFPETTRTASRLGPFPDVDVPTVLINSELEVDVVLVEEQIDYRKPDSDELGRQFRLYEVAGMPHNPAWRHPGLAGSGIEGSCDQPMNAFDYEPVVSMALDHLVAWVEDGTPPPRAEPIATEGDPDAPTAIARDEHGNALGGVRSLDVDVPVATHTATNSGEGAPGIGDCLVFGAQRDFTPAELVELYGDHQGYLEAVDERLDELVEQGWYLDQFAGQRRAQAESFDGFDR